jgi:hypothetical protein
MFLLLILNLRWKEILVRPLGFGVYVNMEPLLGGAFLATPERSIQVFILTAAAQRQPDACEDIFVIMNEIIEVLEQAVIRRNHEPTFAQLAESTEHSDSIQVQVDQLTPEIVQDGNKEFSWRKSKPTHKVRFKIDNDGFVDRWKFQVSGGREHHTCQPAIGVISSKIFL